MGQMKTDWVRIVLAFGVGLFVGVTFIYKIEINTINQALDSMSYCYETYALGGGK